MSQALVTDFFSQSKKRTASSLKPSDSTKSGSVASPNKDLFSNSASSQIRDEFVRIIDAATSSSKGECAPGKKPKAPRPPSKRTSRNAQLGTDASWASARRSATEKRRRVDAKTTTAATNKCVFSHPKQQSTAEPVPNGVPEQLSASAASFRNQASISPQKDAIKSKKNGGQAIRTHCGENMTANKFLLMRIQKQAEEFATAASCTSNSAPTVSSAIAMSMSAVARAKELAAKAKRTKEKDSEDEKIQKETPARESIQQPAYQQYHNLAQDTPPGLSLPYQFKVLAEMFRSMDTVVAMLFNRSETATFSKIKKGVQDMMHKRFEEHHIGQMKTVFPEAYSFRQEKNIPTYNNCIKKGSYQLTMEPVILCGPKEGRPILTASDLLARRHTFHHNLLSIAKHHHKLFLSSLVPQVCVPEEKLTRWHPKFNVDTLPAVQASLLPQPPCIDKLISAQEVLDKAHSFITPKMEKALVSLVQKTGDQNGQCTKTSPQNRNGTRTASPRIPNALNGVSQSLLDRIREKEAQKLQAAMTRSPSQEGRLLMMSRLGELARILRNVFVSEKKPALMMEVVCNRMAASYRSDLTSGEMEKHIRLLAELNPDWLAIHPVRKDLYLKLNKHMDLRVILDKLSCSIREEEKLSAIL
ncbi:DNA replication factor Cdt1 [Phycodurus eques]|uniref:DNA replication factor Cdt1 n=1 Tax=Phycodurus eques TaxID=693459 RepID=UPI002ACD8E6F|nr:DNA replication factor Cdt1 [Phycodurus eques]